MAALAKRCFFFDTLRAICMAAQICSFLLQARVATLIFLPSVNYGLHVMQRLSTRTFTCAPVAEGTG